MAASLKQMINQKLPLNRAIISDILLWITLALLAFYLVYLFAVVFPAKRGQIINLHFKDANEISKGSAVRMMGMDIGFVNDVRIRKDHVEVTVQTNPDAPKIPSGATFTILFTGLAGSKSIEVEAPDAPHPKIHGKPIYLVEEPIRMKDALNYSLDATQALQKGAENIADFFGKKKPVEELQFNIQQTHQMTVTAIHNFTGMQQTIDRMRKDVTTNVLAGLDTLNGLNHASKVIARTTTPATLRSRITKGLQFAQKMGKLFSGQSATVVEGITLQQRLTQMNQANTQISSRMQLLQTQVKTFPLWQWLNNFDTQEGRMVDFLNQADAFFSTDRLPAIKQARKAIQSFNHQLIQWNVKATSVQTQSNPTPKTKQSNP
jgi:ABC-type transporter Mla subunit MlaD